MWKEVYKIQWRIRSIKRANKREIKGTEGNVTVEEKRSLTVILYNQRISEKDVCSKITYWNIKTWVCVKDSFQNVSELSFRKMVVHWDEVAE